MGTGGLLRQGCEKRVPQGGQPLAPCAHVACRAPVARYWQHLHFAMLPCMRAAEEAMIGEASHISVIALEQAVAEEKYLPLQASTTKIAPSAQYATLLAAFSES